MRPSQRFSPVCLTTPFFAQGYSKAALVELIGFVALNTFNNYVEHLDGTPIDWPLAQRLPAALATA